MKPKNRSERRYDVHIADAHIDGDKWSPIEGSENLTYEQMTDWIMHGGDWYFQVVPHGASLQDGKIIVRGVTYGEHCDHEWYVQLIDGERMELCTKCDVRRRVR